MIEYQIKKEGIIVGRFSLKENRDLAIKKYGGIATQGEA